MASEGVKYGMIYIHMEVLVHRLLKDSRHVGAGIRSLFAAVVPNVLVLAVRWSETRDLTFVIRIRLLLNNVIVRYCVNTQNYHKNLRSFDTKISLRSLIEDSGFRTLCNGPPQLNK
jgi:hypothetical protein